MSVRLDDQFNKLLQQAVTSLASPAPPGAETVGGAGRPAEAAGIRWEVSKDSSNGDLSSPVAFKLAAQQHQPPPQLAQRLAGGLQTALQTSPLAVWVDRVEAKSGFVNLWLSPDALAQTVSQILRQRHRYGRRQVGRGQHVLIEFVSANPTGPLSVAHGRQAAVGDALARILRAQEYRVTAEYYLNDEGRQIDLLGQSLRARCLQHVGRATPFPEDGYHGAYVTELASRLAAQHRERLAEERLAEEPLAWFSEQGMAAQLAGIKQDLAQFGLRFDRWSSQRWLRTSGRIAGALTRLQAHGLLYESEGALWFRSTKFGDDKDRVVRKQGGELTYLAPDIAYHHWKFQRGYDRLINLWGPDHHGYVGRLKASVTALGLPADRLVVRLVQLVTLSRHGKPVPMSKRQGEFVTLREVLEEVGADATRFFYLMRTMDSHLDFDLDLAKSQSNENPVYYVQYAHARICSILRYSTAQIPWFRRFGLVDLSRLGEPEERLVLRQLFQFPMVIRGCAQTLEPHGLTVYLQRLAELFHVFYTKHRVVTAPPTVSAPGGAGEDVALSRARLALVRATRWVLANGLGLLGVSAPRRM